MTAKFELQTNERERQRIIKEFEIYKEDEHYNEIMEKVLNADNVITLWHVNGKGYKGFKKQMLLDELIKYEDENNILFGGLDNKDKTVKAETTNVGEIVKLIKEKNNIKFNDRKLFEKVRNALKENTVRRTMKFELLGKESGGVAWF